MANTFDPADYTRAPQITIASGIPLCHALASSCPASAGPLAKKAAKKLKKTADAAQEAWAERQKEVGTVSDASTFAIDQEADASWSALRARLLSYAQLPAKRYPKAKRAAEIVTLLFGPDGLTFLRDKYPVQFATMDTVLGRIQKENLEADIDKLAGREFLEQLRDVHPRYRAMVQALLKKDDGTSQNLLEHTRAMQRAIVAYATQICAMVDEDDEATIELANAALRPIDRHRDSAPARATGGEPPAPADPPTA